MITLSQVRLSDAPAFARLLRSAIHDVPKYPAGAAQAEAAHYTAARVRQQIKKRSTIQVVAKDGRQIVGGCYGTCFAGVSFIEWIGTRKNSRRRGVGKKVLRFFEIVAKQRGVHKIWLNTDVHNKASRAFFRSAGYHRIGKIQQHWYGTDNELWDKKIARPKSYD